VVAIVAIALIGASLVFPGARRAVADWLGISGIEIRVQDDAPTPTTPVRTLANLDLGVETSLEDAQGTVEFPIAAPSGFGEPRVFVRTPPVGGAVSLVYPPGPGLPKTTETRVGMLITEFEARLDLELMGKHMPTTSILQPVDLGDLGFWLEGDPHTVLFLDANGEVQEDSIRLAGNTLMWEDDGISYRLESNLDLEEVLKIARSME
jgi:hypothetical protein